jgi:hypothetical protein
VILFELLHAGEQRSLDSVWFVFVQPAEPARSRQPQQENLQLYVPLLHSDCGLSYFFHSFTSFLLVFSTFSISPM